jgi:signal transduction histidine kinase
MVPGDAVRWATRLAAPQHRIEALAGLAGAAGARHALLLVADDDTRVMLPAPGLRQTLPRGIHWSGLLQRLWNGGRFQGDAEALEGTGLQPVLAQSEAGVALVLVGGTPAPDVLEGMQPLFPLLGRLLACEQDARVAAGELRTARSEMRQYAAQARVLDETRLKLDETVRKLGEEARRAESASRAKDEFLAMLGHELRNPLAPIVTTLEVMRMRDAWRPELDVVERQVIQLKRLMDDLLDVSRIARGKLTLEKAPVDLAQVLDMARECAPELARRHHRLLWDVPPERLMVSGDPSRLVQVFSNLLDNAAKYSEDRSEIRVRARIEQGERVRVTVTDHGIGILPEHLERVFEMFEQGGKSGAFAEGLGLGLSIVRNLVRHHDGRVWAESGGRGQGSTFSVDLPLLQSEAMDEAGSKPETGDVAGIRVMLVDDNADARTTLGWLLRMDGCTVLEVPGGEEALAEAAAFDADVAVLDLGMPGMDGLTLARRLRESLPGRVPHLVALTGFGQPADRARAREAGFDDYLVKPVAPEELKLAIRRVRPPQRLG